MKYLLYDNECPFCIKIVKNISSLINDASISYVPIKSNHGRKLITKYSLEKINSVIYIDNLGYTYIKSRAILNICKLMKFPYKMFYLLDSLPTSILDILYDFIAKNRMYLKK